MAIERYDETASAVFDHRLSRRGLLRALGAGAGLAIAWSSVSAPAGAAAQQGGGASSSQPVRRTPPMEVDSYLTVNEDGTISVFTGKVEYGQGIQTGFGQLVAEELYVPFERVTVTMGITNLVPYDSATVGSGSTRRTGPRLRQAAAEMRQWLLELGSEELGTPVDQLSTEDGAVFVTAEPAKSVPYAALAAGQTTLREMSEEALPPLKDPATYTVVGQPIPRVDVPEKVDGSMIYGYDVIVPGMVHGKIVRPPSIGATLESIDFSEAEAMPGVVGTFRDGDFAGLAAERHEQAVAALAAVKATWAEQASDVTSETIHDFVKATADEGEVLDEEPGDPDTPLAEVAQPLTATFRAPYVSHSPIEPQSSVVHVQADKVEVWTGTQSPFGTQDAVAEVLARPVDEVIVTTVMSGGAFGSKITPDESVEAARLSAAFERPVRVNWTREEQFQHGWFRPAMEVDITAGLDDEGKLAGWKYDLYSSAYYPPGAEEAQGAAASWSADIREIYDVPASKTTWYKGHSPLRPYFWRVNGAATNTLAREVTLDELAELAGVDPVSFRAAMLANNPRMLAVMEAVVAKANWQPGVGSTGQGIGIALGFDAGTYVAEVAKVEVDQTSGQIRVTHFDVALDCGLVVNPAAATHQAEGAVTLSLSPTLREAITFANGKVTNATFEQYAPLRITEAPTIDVVFVEDKTQPIAGMGEPPVSPVPGAVSNAVYDAIGIRLREMPFTPERVLAALEAKL